jgi:hypothetical protein
VRIARVAVVAAACAACSTPGVDAPVSWVKAKSPAYRAARGEPEYMLPSRVFLLSPARLDGERARLLFKRTVGQAGVPTPAASLTTGPAGWRASQRSSPSAARNTRLKPTGP